jgi:hypothetical protein
MPFMQYVENGRAKQATDENIIWRMRFVCWITKATDTHTHNIYRIYSRNLRTFIYDLAAKISECVKFANFCVWRSWSGFYSSIIENTVDFINILL